MIQLTKNQVVSMHSSLIAVTGGSDGVRDQMLPDPPKYLFHEFEDVSDRSNRDILKNEIKKVLADGYDMFIGDY